VATSNEEDGVAHISLIGMGGAKPVPEGKATCELTAWMEDEGFRGDLCLNLFNTNSADLNSSIKSSISSKSSKSMTQFISSKQVHNASNLIYLKY
jgi:hypothetical protein